VNASASWSSGRHGLLLWGLMGCVDTQPIEMQSSLFDHDQWEETPAVDDPLPDHQPDTISCDTSSWRREGDTVEVETQECNYLSLQQPALVGVSPQDELAFVAWHSDLWSGEDGEAHLAVLFDAEVVWETVVSIPADASVFDVTFSSPAGLALGDPVRLHLHNHGGNTWNILDLSLVR